MRLIPFALLLGALVACEDPFAAAQQADNIEGYEKYVAENPGSIYQPQIDIRLEELYAEKAGAEGTKEAWEAYAAKFPEGKHKKDADEALQRFAYDEALAAGTPEAFKGFLEKWPKAEKSRRKKAEGMVKVAEYGKLVIGEPVVSETNMAEDPKGPKDGYMVTASVENQGDLTLEYVNMTVELLGDDGKVLDRKDYPLVSKNWTMPVADIAMQPMKPKEKRTWTWSIAKDGANDGTPDTPEGWNQKVRVYASGLKPAGETDAAAEK
jgi:hypothetical protein